MRKRSLTLLEVIVALGLAAVLLTTLFTFYRELFHARLDIQKNKERVLQRAFVQQRLSQIFEHAIAEIEDGKGLVFSTASNTAAIGPALYFYYDDGIDPDPTYCGTVKAMLSLTPKHQLSLTIWPEREEILLEGVTDMKIAFYDPGEKEWTSLWGDGKEALPIMVKLSLQTEALDEFVFFLPNAMRKISYKKR